MADGMELRELITLVSKRWITIAVTTASVVAIAFLITALSEPVYEADMRLFVAESPSGAVERTSVDTYQGILISERLAQTYSQMVSRASFLDKAADAAGLSLGGNDLVSMVEARAIKNTQIIAVSAQGSSPESAANLANAVGELLVEEIAVLNSPSDGTEASSTVTLKVMDAARPPASPVSPSPVVNIMVGLILGGLLGILIAFGRDHFDTRIKVVKDLTQIMGDTPVIAQVPKVDDARIDRLVVRRNSQTPVSEAYRSLRTSIGYINFDGATKLIVFTSSVPKEGKTTITANVGAALAHAGNRVLLVGADMRRPRLHQAVSVRSDAGLSSVLISATDIDDAIVPTNTEGLFVLPSGPIPPNPAELLGSQRMSDLVKTLSERYDYVLFDAPPLLPVTDTMVLAAITDGLILVSRAGVSKREALERTLASLSQMRSKLVGLILNGVPPTSGYEYSYTSSDVGEKASSFNAPKVALMMGGVALMGYLIVAVVGTQL